MSAAPAEPSRRKSRRQVRLVPNTAPPEVVISNNVARLGQQLVGADGQPQTIVINYRVPSAVLARAGGGRSELGGGVGGGGGGGGGDGGIALSPSRKEALQRILSQIENNDSEPGEAAREAVERKLAKRRARRAERATREHEPAARASVTPAPGGSTALAADRERSASPLVRPAASAAGAEDAAAAGHAGSSGGWSMVRDRFGSRARLPSETAFTDELERRYYVSQWSFTSDHPLTLAMNAHVIVHSSGDAIGKWLHVTEVSGERSGFVPLAYLRVITWHPAHVRGVPPVPPTDELTALAGLASAASRASLGTSAGARARSRSTLAPMRRELPYWHDPYTDTHLQLYIKAISVDALVRKVVQPHGADPTLVHVMLTTHSNYIQTDELFDLLLAYWSAEPDPALYPGGIAAYDEAILPLVRRRILELVTHWVQVFFQDFSSFPTAKARVIEFIAAVRDSETDADLLGRIQSLALLYERRCATYNLERVPNMEGPPPALTEDARDAAGSALESRFATPPLPLLDARVSSSRYTTEMHPLELARQITILDFEAFCLVEAHEFLKQAWCKANKEVRAKHLLVFCERFNTIGQFAATEVLRRQSTAERAQCMCHFIDVAVHGLDLQNYHLAMGIVTGLQSAAMNRLKYTFERLPPRYVEKFETLNQSLSMSRNYLAYRAIIAGAEAPAIPYIGVFLQDLTFIDDGNESKIGAAKLVNVEKERMTCAVIDKVMALRKSPYRLRKVPEIQAFLKSQVVLTDKQLYQLSLEVEPRAMAEPTGDRSPIQYDGHFTPLADAHKKHVLSLVIDRASGIPPMDRNGFSDPFCVVLVDTVEVARTEVQKKTLEPAWHARVDVCGPFSADSVIEIVLRDWDLLGPSQYMGSVQLMPGKIALPGFPVTRQSLVDSRTGSVVGDLYVGAMFAK